MWVTGYVEYFYFSIIYEMMNDKNLSSWTIFEIFIQHA